MNKEFLASYNILKSVYFNGAYSSIELNKNFDANINFGQVTKIVYGVLDNDVKIKFFIKQFYKKAPKKQVELLIKIGAYIHLELSTPKFVIVNEIAEIAKRVGMKPYVGFINAVLKNVVNTNLEYPNKNDKTNYLSIKYSKPKWFIDLLTSNFDGEFIGEYLNHELTNRTHIRINTNVIDMQSFKDTMQSNNIAFTPSVLQDGLYVDYSLLVRFKELENMYFCQGITSMITALNISGNSVLDACSAPGGKAIYYASKNKSSNVIACDIHQHRVNLIDGYVKNANLNNITTMCLDATVQKNEFLNKFDCVVLDVPCSGLGITNKKPDILLDSNVDINQIAKLQSDILNNASKYVNIGGSIIYSTCTILPQENQKVLNDFLQKNKNFKIDKINTYGVDCVLENGFASFYPHISNTEGFFIGKIIRDE